MFGSFVALRIAARRPSGVAFSSTNIPDSFRSVSRSSVDSWSGMQLSLLVQRPSQCPERASPMRDGMLLGRHHLRKRAAVALRRNEDWVVAEAARTARRRGNDALDLAPRHDLAAVGLARDRDGR